MALVATPVWAQRGGGGAGGHGGGGGHGASGAGFAGHAGTASGFHSSISSGWHGNGSAWRGNNWGWRGNNWYRFRYYGGRWYPYWGYAGYWYPGWGWYGWDDSSYDYPSDAEVAQNYPPGYDSSYANLPPSGSSASYASPYEVQSIQGEIDQLKAQQEARRSQPQEPLMHSDTVLVYRDGHTETIGNYAIAGNTLWVFNQASAKKIPLSELNLPATKRDNEDHGVDFVVPSAH